MYTQVFLNKTRETHFLDRKVKVKCTLVQALRLCTDRMAHRGSSGIALPFHDHGTRRGWGVTVTPRPLSTPGKKPVPIVQKAVWAPGLVRTGAPWFDPRTVQPVVSRYTDWATGPTAWSWGSNKNFDPSSIINFPLKTQMVISCRYLWYRRNHERLPKKLQ
jgi:hypothetical protein